MPKLEQTLVQCDYCPAEEVIQGQLRSAADYVASNVIEGTHIRIPPSWKFIHGKYACPKHSIVVDCVDLGRAGETGAPGVLLPYSYDCERIRQAKQAKRTLINELKRLTGIVRSELAHLNEE